MSLPYAGNAPDSIDADQVDPETGRVETEPQGEPPARRVRSQPVSQIEPKRRQFLWQDRLPLGEVTLWVGHAGIGKSQAAVWLASQVSRGTLPGELYGHPSPVLYLGSEDSWAYTLAPRFAAADADLTRVHRLYAETDTGDGVTAESTVSLAVDLDALRDEIAATGARLVVLDALLSTFGSAKLTEQGTVRRYLEPLAQLSQELNIAVVGVAHFRKASDPNPLHMIAGSAEFGQVVRSAIGFAADREAEDGSCVLSLVKTNIAPAGLPSIRYRIDSATVDTADGPTDVGRFVPLGDTDQDVGELLNQESASTEDRAERNDAVAWLRAHLAESGGEAVAGDLFKAAERDGFAKRTIQRARSKAGVTTRKGDRGWLWTYSPTDER
ncbi:AAA family ATPase [Actinopolyspora erythraea]|uniref:AAA family ATPase n=1 Tax=Actinopolyspora erythraea TaxID=414996 RepID=UPI00069354DD|nr:AAA family ATPase [Actinopolyspora erythraea]